MLRGRLLQLTTITGLVWAAELGTFALLASDKGTHEVVNSLLSVFSQLLTSAGLTQHPDRSYLLVARLFILPAGLAAAAAGLRARWRSVADLGRGRRRAALLPH